MNKKLIKAAVIGALFSVAPMSFAADEVEDIKAPSMLDEFSFSANVGLYSDYIFRGYTQTQNEPAIQGGFDVEHSSGLYAGTWASNVDWTTAGDYMDKNSVEIDVYAGWAGDLGFYDLGFDIGVLQFFYPGNDTADAVETDATEIYFGFNKAEVRTSDAATLNDQAAWLKKYPSITIVVEGHCDERGTREYNRALGERRANAVKEYLVSRGISANRVQTISYGKERPAVLGSNESAWQQNRRGVSIVKGGAS